jgi:hypothetical protein
MRPWILLGAAALGLGVAGWLALPRGEAPAPARVRPLVETTPPRDVPPDEEAPDPAQLAVESLPEEPEPLGEDFSETPVPEQEGPPPEPEPALDFELAPLFNGAGEPSRFLVRSALQSKITRDHPTLEVSPEGLERASDAVLRIRAARLEMAKLAFDAANAPRRVLLREEILSAYVEFEKALGISPTAFTRPVPGQDDSQGDAGEGSIPDPDSYDAPPPETGR